MEGFKIIRTSSNRDDCQEELEVLKMTTINVTILHPTNGSDIEVGLPENIVLQDVFDQLIEANFLNAGQQLYGGYSGILKPNDSRIEFVQLDNSKTISENGIVDNDIIRTIIATQAGYGPPLANNVKFVHPTNLFDINIVFSDNILFKDTNMDDITVKGIFDQLIYTGFLNPDRSYGGVIMANSRFRNSRLLENDKSIRVNCVEDDDIIQIVMLDSAFGAY